MKANSFTDSTEAVTDLLGFPAAGAIVVAATAVMTERVGITTIFILDAATYLFSAFMIFRIRVGSNAEAEEEAEAEASGNILRSVADGLRYMAGNALLLTNALLMTLVLLVCLMTYVLTYGYAFQVVDAGAFGYGIMEAGFGGGVIIGSLAVGQWGKHFSQGPLILVGIFLCGVAVIPLAFVENLWIAVVCNALAGVGNMILLIPSVTLVQTITADDYLGRVFSVRGVLFSLALIGATAIGGYAAETFGIQFMWGVTGALLVLIAIVACFIPSARNLPAWVEE